jgi:CMP-N-acetylneuraminic acid synthetase/spore coat polysaccharide biosynthesis predicted glycosyltransferase SpsG
LTDSDHTNVLVVIPARGGSKGIPRKNLRSLNGRPLLAYAVAAAQDTEGSVDVVVSSEDEEVLSLARKLGAHVHPRDPTQAKDETTLDPVVHAAYEFATRELGREYEIVVTLQPTSPLIRSASLDHVVRILIERPEIDTVISARDSTHLTWRKEDGRYVPNYQERVNRQFLTPTFTETGALLATRTRVLAPANRIGAQVELYLVSGAESIDIDTYEDWSLCEYYLRRRRVLFVVSGHAEIGLGHVYNTLLLANDVLDHEVAFLVDSESQLAFDTIAARNFKVFKQEETDIIDDIARLEPDVVVSDRLDTSVGYMEGLKGLGVRTVNFEDLGEGARLADLVVNAIYPEDEVLPNHYFGHRYFCLRDEFLLTDPTPIRQVVGNVLLTFGGVDPNNLTHKVLRAIFPYCVEEGIRVSVVAGFGFDKYESIERFEDVDVFKDVGNISDHMQKADVIFTSAGRTTYECASVGTPTIVMAQNPRELTHFFASEQFGFLNLGLGESLDEPRILDAFQRVARSYASRKRMSELMLETDLRGGRKRVLGLIRDIIEQT